MDLDPRIDTLFEMVRELQEQMTHAWAEIAKLKESQKDD